MKINLKLGVLAGAILSVGMMPTIATPIPVNTDNNELGTAYKGSPASQADETVDQESGANQQCECRRDLQRDQRRL